MANDYSNFFGDSPLQIPTIKVEHAKEILCAGIRHYAGGDAKWLQCYEGVCNWLEDNQGKGLLIYGTNGIGKSLIGYYILDKIFDKLYAYYGVYKIRANDLRDLSEGLYVLAQKRIILIDDVGTESIVNIYGEKKDMFGDMVDYAEHYKKMLVITTNLTPKEIQERYGLRTLDRLHALTTPICFQGESFRGK